MRPWLSRRLLTGARIEILEIHALAANPDDASSRGRELKFRRFVDLRLRFRTPPHGGEN